MNGIKQIINMYEDIKIKEIITRLEVKRDKQMNTYFKQFYTETIKMLSEEFLYKS
jgi:hypothetical protein